MARHEVQVSLAYRPEQLFDLAADVESYPEFLPGYFATRITGREGNVYYSDQVVGFRTFRKHFHSKTVLQRPERIVVTSDDRLFRSFELTWRFEPLPGGGCRVSFLVELELRSRLARDLFRRTIANTVGSIMSAFVARAHRLYDPPAARHPDDGR
jgi:coenzyme Q-binding protein COQ10